MFAVHDSLPLSLLIPSASVIGLPAPVALYRHRPRLDLRHLLPAIPARPGSLKIAIRQIITLLHLLYYDSDDALATPIFTAAMLHALPLTSHEALSGVFGSISLASWIFLLVRTVQHRVWPWSAHAAASLQPFKTRLS